MRYGWKASPAPPTFQFTKSFRLSAQPEEELAPGPLHPVRKSGIAAMPLRILVAEDNTINQRVVAGILGKAGHSTTLVSNGREALASVSREPFDLIVMDAVMDAQMPV